MIVDIKEPTCRGVLGLKIKMKRERNHLEKTAI